MSAITGMRFAAVAMVRDRERILCALHDEIPLGLRPGDLLDVETLLCIDPWQSMTPITIQRASHASGSCTYPALEHPRLERYVSMPIVLETGAVFGELLAIDPSPAILSPRAITLLTEFAALIGTELDADNQRQTAERVLRDERATSELREQFIAILGHDLRNPLQAISATSELLIRSVANPAAAAMATRIRVNTKRMSSLIDDVLDFARGRLGSGIGLQLAVVEDITTPLLSVINELQDGFAGRQILANIDTSGAMQCDIGRLQQVASNLIGNALTHGSAEHPVKVTATVDADDLVLEVWNQGEAISLDHQSKIFEPFWRRDTSAKRQGLGLGLFICSQIVRAHGGNLSVTSTMEAGTTFTARLPKRR